MDSSNAASTGWRSSGEVGRKLKSRFGWNSNGNGGNSSGFNALPGGVRHSSGGFDLLGDSTRFWSSSELDQSTAWNRGILYNNDGMDRYADGRNNGFSVRCLRGEAGSILISPSGGEWFSADSLVKITVPAGAKESPTLISVKHFDKGMADTLSLNYESHPTEKHYNIAIYSYSDGNWEDLKLLSIDQASKKIQVEIKHFSIIFIVKEEINLVVDIPGKFLKKGDLIYTLTYQDQKFHWFPGYVGMYLGTEDPASDSNDGQKIIESTPNHVRFSTLDEFCQASSHLYMGARYDGTISDEQRRQIAEYAIDQLGKPWSYVGQRNISEGRFSCVGFIEAAYDHAVPRLSIIPFIGFPNLEAGVIYPYNQYKLTKPVDEIT